MMYQIRLTVVIIVGGLNFSSVAMNSQVEQMTPIQELLEGAKNGSQALIERGLARGANLEDHNDDGERALHIAAFKGHKECLITLLLKGADVHAKDNNCRRALHLASWQGHSDCLKELLQWDQDTNAKDP